jgi:hypothetical protein
MTATERERIKSIVDYTTILETVIDQIGPKVVNSDLFRNLLGHIVYELGGFAAVEVSQMTDPARGVALRIEQKKGGMVDDQPTPDVIEVYATGRDETLPELAPVTLN